MSFLAPLAFWGMAALALPIILHLRRRRVGRTVQVGSVRHLESLPSAERRGVRLREPWLLLLRLALLTTVVLLLARPVLDRGERTARPFALIDSAAPSTLRDSLASGATVRVERIDAPWQRLQELDDSLPPGVPIVIAASTSSDRFSGPRPMVGRPVTWIALSGRDERTAPSPAANSRTGRPTTTITPTEARALHAAIAAARDGAGPLADSAGWQARLPSWWRDSLATSAFPIAVARALDPAHTSPAPVPLSLAQVLPTRGDRRPLPREGTDLHWWFWSFAILLFGLERWWQWRAGATT